MASLKTKLQARILLISFTHFAAMTEYTDHTERYFKNKDIELSYLNEICTVYSIDMFETLYGSPEQKHISTRYYGHLKNDTCFLIKSKWP